MDTKQEKDLTFPNFDDIKVSTKTFTAMTNLSIKLKELFEILPITEYIVIPKKRGRKKKSEVSDPNKDIPPGSIISIDFEGETRGVKIKPKKLKTGKKKKWFRNSMTVEIMFDKRINFKICRNGTFQMTGCKTHDHAELCVKYIWEYIKDKNDMYTFTRDKQFQVLFIPSMRNIDFSLGFLVDREKLNKYMCSQDEFHCLLETSFGYTGVNIKIPLENDISTMKIKKLTYRKNKWISVWTTYQEYLNILQPKDRDSKLKDERYNTFLVFHSGKVIMSGLTADFMRNVYYYFLKIIKNAYNKIEERLDNNLELSLEDELFLTELENI